MARPMGTLPRKTPILVGPLQRRRAGLHLPVEVVEELSRVILPTDASHRPSRSFIDDRDVESERDFLATCKQDSKATVGVWDCSPVRYGLLVERQAAFNISGQDFAELWAGLVPPEQFRTQMELMEQQSAGSNGQLLGYVGRLTFDPQYRRERAELEARWWALVPPTAAPYRGPRGVPRHAAVG
jgi:hypothetical protein